MDSVTVRRRVATATMGLYALVEGLGAYQTHGWMRAAYVLFGAALVVGTVGLHRRKLWARWLGLGTSLVGLANVGVAAHFFHANLEMMLFALLPSTLLLTLVGKAMAKDFIDSEPIGSVWRLDDKRLSLVSLGIVMSVASVGILLIYGAAHAPLRATAMSLALALSVSAALVAAGRSAGLLIMLAAGICIAGVGLDAADMALSPTFSMRELLSTHTQRYWSSFAAVILVPGAIAGVAAFSALAVPMMRYLRDYSKEHVKA